MTVFDPGRTRTRHYYHRYRTYRYGWGLANDLVEDAAQAHGARTGGKRVGGLGTIGCFSFHPSKNLAAAGDGGDYVVWRDDVAMLGEPREAIAPAAEPVPQHPRYRGFWYDSERHAMVGLHLGLDLIGRGGRYHLIELNLNAALAPERREVYGQADPDGDGGPAAHRGGDVGPGPLAHRAVPGARQGERPAAGGHPGADPPPPLVSDQRLLRPRLGGGRESGGGPVEDLARALSGGSCPSGVVPARADAQQEPIQLFPRDRSRWSAISRAMAGLPTIFRGSPSGPTSQATCSPPISSPRLATTAS